MSDETKKGLYEREKESLWGMHTRLDANRPWCDLIDELEKEFPDLILSSSAWLGATVSFLLGAIQEIVPILRKLGKLGLKHDGVRETGDGRLIWRFHEGSNSKTVLEVVAHFKTDGQCRKVQVGTKEVPVYEVRCGADMSTPKELAKEVEAD